jgi:hypothetical protein
VIWEDETSSETSCEGEGEGADKREGEGAATGELAPELPAPWTEDPAETMGPLASLVVVAAAAAAAAISFRRLASIYYQAISWYILILFAIFLPGCFWLRFRLGGSLGSRTPCTTGSYINQNVSSGQVIRSEHGTSK